jgi:hypothetical protein
MHILEWLRASYVIAYPSSAIYTWLENFAHPYTRWTLFLKIQQAASGLAHHGKMYSG